MHQSLIHLRELVICDKTYLHYEWIVIHDKTYDYRKNLQQHQDPRYEDEKTSQVRNSPTSTKVPAFVVRSVSPWVRIVKGIVRFRC